MKIKYYCRQCNRQVGQLDAAQADVSQLGSDVLNDADQQQTVQMEGEHGLAIRTICDDCNESKSQSSVRYDPNIFS
ncbi:anti-sigma-F factor Fin [Halobacillus andaensis]|uniref:anti-sigma-F factor Fin n=1 Tax=Halobacillus andaensis TaxID=1176239 RepID=UPI003D749C73